VVRGGGERGVWGRERSGGWGEGEWGGGGVGGGRGGWAESIHEPGPIDPLSPLEGVGTYMNIDDSCRTSLKKVTFELRRYFGGRDHQGWLASIGPNSGWRRRYPSRSSDCYSIRWHTTHTTSVQDIAGGKAPIIFEDGKGIKGGGSTDKHYRKKLGREEVVMVSWHGEAPGGGGGRPRGSIPPQYEKSKCINTTIGGLVRGSRGTV